MVHGTEIGHNPEYRLEVFRLGIEKVGELACHPSLKFLGKVICSIAQVFCHSGEASQCFL